MTARLPASARAYLGSPSLADLWAACRTRLEANALSARGTVTVTFDDEGVRALNGLLMSAHPPGPVRVRLDQLDAALRSSSANAGLLAVLQELTGSALVDRQAVRAAARDKRTTALSLLDEALSSADLAGRPWAGQFVESVRRSGILTRAGFDGARQSTQHFAAALRVLAGPLVALEQGQESEPERLWELGEIASASTGTAHGLDDGTLAGALLLRAAAAAASEPGPSRSDGRRALWERLGVLTDLVSGTVLVHGLRPPGDDAWSAMMRSRADLLVPTHLTVAELRAIEPAVVLAPAGQVVSVCENPQVLQSASRAGVRAPLVCLSGNASAAGSILLRRLVAQGCPVRYHGDFDWPGIAIAARVLDLGASPWRLGARDYERALAAPGRDRLPLAGRPVSTPWDPELAHAMHRAGVAVHEEAQLAGLLKDLDSLTL